MKKGAVGTGIALLLFGLGCGSGVSEALLLALESGARTAVDVFISDLLTNLPDIVTTLPPIAGEPADGDDIVAGDGDSGDGNDDPGGGDLPDDGGGGELVANAASGEMTFVMNACGLCHCDDASGGCLSGSPDLRATDIETVREKLQGEPVHVGGKFPDLTQQELVDLVAFLADLGGDPTDSLTDVVDPGKGQALFTANACAVCHCDDGSGGCLPGSPDIRITDIDTLSAVLVGERFHSGGKTPNLTDRDIADMVAFLGG